jgi:hypothetical protein
MMKSVQINKFFCLLLFLAMPVICVGQETKKHVCKARVFAALRPIPRLDYKCQPEEVPDYGDEVLKRPERLAGIRRYIRGLAGFTSSDWWNADVNDLNVCSTSGKPGPLSPEDEDALRYGGKRTELFGDDSIRLILTTDPCYQRGFGGSDAFLLHRSGGKVYVTEALDGFYSRSDDPMGIDFGLLKSERIIEINTNSGGLHPTVTNFYFIIDRKSGKAVPKKLFRVGGKLTNEMTSAIDMYGQYQDPTSGESISMQVIKHGKLAKSFIVLEEDFSRESGPGGPNLKTTTYRWNGRLYAVGR